MAEGEFPLDEVLDIQKRFAKLYLVTGLIAIHDNYVQVTDAALAELAEPDTWNIIKVSSDDEPGYTYHADIRVKGMKFMTVLYEEELAKYGLEISA